MDTVFNKDEIINPEFVSHDGVPMKPARQKGRDKFMYQGALEDNVTPVIAPTFYSSGLDQSEDHIYLHLDVTPG
ncbi:MAG TPA: hypothetical protein VH186_17450 [Chloroflexia bacterium]|nr:hypothetical protein [Chloroflexia bacterium]